MTPINRRKEWGGVARDDRRKEGVRSAGGREAKVETHGKRHGKGGKKPPRRGINLAKRCKENERWG